MTPEEHFVDSTLRAKWKKEEGVWGKGEGLVRNNNLARTTTPPDVVYPRLVFVRLALFEFASSCPRLPYTTPLQLLIAK